eukprot:SAG11_NODE_489_length_8994_cov_8.385904_1_plen_100_part_00
MICRVSPSSSTSWPKCVKHSQGRHSPLTSAEPRPRRPPAPPARRDVLRPSALPNVRLSVCDDFVCAGGDSMGSRCAFRGLLLLGAVVARGCRFSFYCLD